MFNRLHTPMSDNYDAYDKQELIHLLRTRDRERRFGLVWESDAVERERALNDDFVAADIIPDFSEGTAPHRNLVIEGDNFDALRWLRMTHKNKVKCIYIDPPYNTGNNDFIYNDKFIDKEDAYRHSKWLEFMYRRLVLARDLLRDDGMIFVSIDHNEMAHVKILLDQVFGENNCLTDFIWQTEGNFDNQARFKVCHEYILLYAKDEKKVSFPQAVDPNLEEDSKIFNENIINSIVKNGNKNPVSEIFIPAGMPTDFEKGIIKKRSDAFPHYSCDVHIEDYITQNDVTISSGWANRNLFLRFIANEFTSVYDKKNQLTKFSLDKNGTIVNIKERDKNFSHVLSVIKNVGTVEKSGELLKNIGINFTFPKPLGLIEYILKMLNDKNALILDFFAGSGTTAHAVMKQNAEDGGDRRFILVSSTEATEKEPDKNICRDVTRTRLQAAVNGYHFTKGRKRTDIDGLGGGFAYMTLQRIPRDHIGDALRHTQIRAALELIHFNTLTPGTAEQGVHAIPSENGAELLLYAETCNDASCETIQRIATGYTDVTLYAWQPSSFAQRLFHEGLQVFPVPQALIDRFGGGR